MAGRQRSDRKFLIIIKQPKTRDNYSYYSDGFCKIGEEAHVYEFFGCYWHGCDRCRAIDRNDPVKAQRAEQKRREVVERLAYFERLPNYTTHYIWECQFDEWMREQPNYMELRNLQKEIKTAQSREPLRPRDALR